MASGLETLLKNYGITGVPAIDGLLFTLLVPIIISYVTVVFTCIQKFITSVILDKISQLYRRIKRRFLGKVEFRLSVSQERSIYPTIRNLFFSSALKSDDIDNKMINRMNLITEAKYSKYNYHPDEDNLYDLYMDDANALVFEKHIDYGTSIAKKYFEFEGYYIVVSENKQTDYSHYFSKYKKNEPTTTDKPATTDTDKDKDKDTGVEYFMLFEAIPKSDKNNKDADIIKKFLYNRFKISTRIPYKYIIDISGSLFANKFSQNDQYINNDGSIAELIISDGLDKFKHHPKIKDFYDQESNVRITSKSGISATTKVSSKGNVLNKDTMDNDTQFMSLTDDTTVSSTIFSAHCGSILKYFFGNKFVNIQKQHFYFRDNKIILFIHHLNNTCSAHKYFVCIVSFQQILVKEDVLKIFREMVPTHTKKNEKITIYSYQGDESGWNGMNCEARSFNTIYLPIKIKKIVMGPVSNRNGVN